MEKIDYLKGKQALLLDMNSTFMFGEDRFNKNEDYSIFYKTTNGSLPKPQVNKLINQVCDYLGERYPLAEFREQFPSLAATFKQLSDKILSDQEIAALVNTFSFHELGRIPETYINALARLAEHFRLGLVIDIWPPKQRWLDYFRELGILDLFEAMSFSSDHQHVKPSTYGFRDVLEQMNLNPDQAIFIGDSVRRDLGGAKVTWMDCILVGISEDSGAIDSFSSLVEFCDAMEHP